MYMKCLTNLSRGLRVNSLARSGIQLQSSSIHSGVALAHYSSSNVVAKKGDHYENYKATPADVLFKSNGY